MSEKEVNLDGEDQNSGSPKDEINEKPEEKKSKKEELRAEKLETSEPLAEEPVSEVSIPEETKAAEANPEETKTEEPVSEVSIPEETKTEEAIPEETKTEEPVPELSIPEETKTEEAIPEEKDNIDEGDVLIGHIDPISNQSVEEFDWDNADKDADTYSNEERSKLEALYDETLSTISENEVVDGNVVFMNKREVVINIGYKSEAVVSINEFRYNPELKIGDSVEVYVETQEDKHGQLILSHKKARALRSWDRVNEAYEKAEIIKGYIKCRTKGGMIVDVFGIEAFLPGSQIDVKPIRDYDIFVGKTMEFKIVKINHEFKNVVVSHKALIEAELEIQRQDIISKLEKGQVLEGTVKNITSYGVFIDLGGVDGLIHITDLSWGRVTHPEEIVELDQKINVVILDFDDAKKRIALGLKQLTKHPWDSLDAELKVGDIVKGKVVVLADYGAFIEIATGVEGLIHVSEMSWSQHLRSAQEFLKVGDPVEAQILTLDRDDRKMSLGIKQLKEDPWLNIDEKYKIGSKHKSKVRNFTGFGVFVEIEEGIDGLIHISDLSWTKKIKHPAEFIAVGDEIEVVVLEIDKENRRLSLGHKQLEENPWDVFETIFGVDSIHEGTIVNIFDKGAVIALPYGVEGFATPRHMVKEDGNAPTVDEKLEFKVIEFSKASKRIILSHSRVFEDAKKAAFVKDKQKKSKTSKKAGRDIKSGLESTTLGDITDLAAIKSKMEESEKISADKLKETLIKKASIQAEKIIKKEKPVETKEVVDELEAPKEDKSIKKETPLKEADIEKNVVKIEGKAEDVEVKKEVKKEKKDPAKKPAAKKTVKEDKSKTPASKTKVKKNKVAEEKPKAEKKTETKNEKKASAKADNTDKAKTKKKTTASGKSKAKESSDK